jgi:hypothetical protein
MLNDTIRAARISFTLDNGRGEATRRSIEVSAAPEKFARAVEKKLTSLEKRGAYSVSIVYEA